MAIKRKKNSLTLQTVVLKKMKICNVPLDSKHLNTVLSQLSGPEFDRYMVACGPRTWKESSDAMSVDDAKKLVLMILCRPELLIPFAAYLTLYNNDIRPAQHIYELHLGSTLCQIAIDKSVPKTAYLCSMQKEAKDVNMLPILPVLLHNKHYFCLDRNCVKDVDVLPLKARLDMTDWSCEQLYYAKLTNAMNCAKMQRWAECFAHSLSALDCHQPDYEHVHDVFMYMATSAGTLSVPIDWCCNVLDRASLYSTSLEHAWQRIIVFQGILLHNGMFDVEKEVFDMSAAIMVQSSSFYQSLLIQHMLGQLAQIENILAYQYVRQKFHSDCEAFCKREPCINYTYEDCHQLIANIDMMSGKLRGSGYKEYFRGYANLYNSMTRHHSHAPGILPVNQMNMAIMYFDLARMLMKANNPLYADLNMMINFLKRKFITVGYIEKYFAEIEMSKYSLGARRFLFRAMVITMYWDNKFQPFPLLLLSTHARDMDNKVTAGFSYRNSLVNSCVKIHTLFFTHKENDSFENYPSIKTVKDATAKMFWIRMYTSPDFSNVSKYKPGPKESATEVVPSSESLLSKQRLAEQMYAFGYQIIEAWTTL